MNQSLPHSSALLSIRDLTISYRSNGSTFPALQDISLDIMPGETVGLVGESGSGKSTLALTIMSYLSKEGNVDNGEIWFDGKDLLRLSAEEMRNVWGNEIALVPQNPFSSLNPSLRIGEQIGEILRLHKGVNRKEAELDALSLLKQVRIADPKRVLNSYPHQISGGMQQRIMIAMALSTKPKLLILDEPTTGLDVTTEAVVLDLFRELMKDYDTSSLYVTHDLGVVARICDRVAVLYASEMVELGTTDVIYNHELHPYTSGLIDSVPRMGQRKDTNPLNGIVGQIPNLGELPKGCVFAPRCTLAIDVCHDERPAIERPADGHQLRCHRWEEILAGEISSSVERENIGRKAVEQDEVVLNLDELKVNYPVRRTIMESLKGNAAKQVQAVDGVSLRLAKGQTLGIVGESGSGKSSLARAIIGLVDCSDGVIELSGIALPKDISNRSRDVLRQLQMVFQDPDEALNPYLTVGESLSRPYITLMGDSNQEADEKVADLLQAVRLPVDFAGRRPNQLSGGERQRVAIARAFAAEPDLLLADEPVSALDVSVRASILNMLNELQIENETAVIFISHDIGVVSYIADQVAVMYLGQLMELGDAEQIFTPPYHPYSEALLSAVPVPDPTTKQERIRLEGDIPSAIDTPAGCPFHTRCPRFLGDVCKTEKPAWQETSLGKRIYCHIPVAVLEADQERVIAWEGSE